ncbi:MAG: B12-binding domain-containing radical SAM protein [Candidatus Omnitrophica bacterium]|nr:B12-binding domain-containing radical SAM protein [Candidatus Omnitrophota bacterium]
MKVLLVRPVTPKDMVLNTVPPIGLGYLASALRKVGIEVGILDCIAKNYNFKKFNQYVKDFSPNIIGFQAFSNDVHSINVSVGLMRKINPKAILIVGGAHPSGVLEEIFDHIPDIDFAFRGESEIGLPVLINYLAKGEGSFDKDLFKTIPGLIWKDEDGKIIVNPPVFVDNLDMLEFPSWDMIDPRTYPKAPQGVIFKNFPIAPLIVTRGCPFPCTFCAGNTISGYKIRARTIENVFKEITFLYESFNVREFHILDDNFTFEKQFVRNFCDEILKRNLKFSWCCPNGIRLDTLDKELLTLMKRAGCYYISVGIESGSDMVLKDMNKKLSIPQIEEQINLIKDCGLDVNGFFIIGYPTETEKDIKKTIDFGARLPLTRAQFYNFLPLPGTEIFRSLKLEGVINELDWDKLFQSKIPYAPSGLTKKKIDFLLKWAHLKFYFNFKRLFCLFRDIHKFGQFKFILKRALAYMCPKFH